MSTTTIAGHEVEVNEEGFLTRPDQWSEDLAPELAALIGLDLTDKHWELFLNAVGRGELLKTDPRFKNIRTRTQSIDALYQLNNGWR